MISVTHYKCCSNGKEQNNGIHRGAHGDIVTYCNAILLIIRYRLGCLKGTFVGTCTDKRSHYKIANCKTGRCGSYVINKLQITAHSLMM